MKTILSILLTFSLIFSIAFLSNAFSSNNPFSASAQTKTRNRKQRNNAWTWRKYKYKEMKRRIQNRKARAKAIREYRKKRRYQVWKRRNRNH